MTGSVTIDGTEYVLNSSDFEAIKGLVEKHALMTRDKTPDGSILERPRVADLDPAKVEEFVEKAKKLEPPMPSTKEDSEA